MTRELGDHIHSLTLKVDRQGNRKIVSNCLITRKSITFPTWFTCKFEYFSFAFYSVMFVHGLCFRYLGCRSDHVKKWCEMAKTGVKIQFGTNMTPIMMWQSQAVNATRQKQKNLSVSWMPDKSSPRWHPSSLHDLWRSSHQSHDARHRYAVQKNVVQFQTWQGFFHNLLHILRCFSTNCNSINRSLKSYFSI